MRHDHYQTQKREGKCPNCGGVPQAGKVRCQNCADAKNRNRNQRRLKNLCRDCGNTPAKGRTRCFECRVITSTHLKGVELQKAVNALESFNGVCQCCSTQNAGGSGEFHVDHKDDRFRGILCHNCNVSLGLLGESEDRILLLLSYLRRTGQ
jgi:hypothetical protein